MVYATCSARLPAGFLKIRARVLGVKKILSHRCSPGVLSPDRMPLLRRGKTRCRSCFRTVLSVGARRGRWLFPAVNSALSRARARSAAETRTAAFYGLTKFGPTIFCPLFYSTDRTGRAPVSGLLNQEAATLRYARARVGVRKLRKLPAALNVRVRDTCCMRTRYWPHRCPMWTLKTPHPLAITRQCGADLSRATAL